MDDNDLILGALRLGMPSVRDSRASIRKKRLMKEIEPSPTSTGYDAVYKPSKQKKIKTLDSWNSTDFIKYVSKGLGEYGLVLGGAQHTDVILQVHDLLVDEIPSLNNKIMREYFDWWVGNYARNYGDREVSLYEFTQDRHIKKFSKQFVSMRSSIASNSPATKTSVHIKSKQTTEKVSDAELYAVGGLKLLLIKRGIVCAYMVLKDLGISNIFTLISQELRSLTKETVKRIMSVTMSSIYPGSDVVDFISIARPVLLFYCIKEFDAIDYKDFFKE